MNKILRIIFIIFVNLLLIQTSGNADDEKIKIGLLVPMSGDDKDLGQLLIKSTRLALKDINNIKLEIFPKDTSSNPSKALKSAIELKEMGIKIVIGPVFYDSLTYLEEAQGMIFLSFTNKTLNLPKNVISAGINAASQINTIKKFIESNNY